MKWDKNDLKIAIELVEKGFNYVEIGKQLNRTTDSIRNKLTRKGYKFTLLNKSRENRNCLNCYKEFETTIGNEKVFCCHSCAAVFNNKNRIVIKYCVCCKKARNNNNKYFCSHECEKKHKKNIIFEKIENGNLSFGEKQYKDYLIHKYGNKCMDCDWNKVNQKTGLVPIQLEHIDGDSDNNKIENLKLLCPNCHSLTPTFGSLNKNGRDSKRKKYRKNWRNKNKFAGNA